MAKKKPRPKAKPARVQVPECRTYREAMQAFHANAAALRKLSGKTQAELAAELGVTRAFVGIFELGGQKISLGAMCALAELYGVTIAAMLTPGAWLVRDVETTAKPRRR